MAENSQEGKYGYSSDEARVSPFNFGLNAGVCFLKKFEWIPNGGKDGAEREALDIIFTINGADRGYRQFDINKAFDKAGNEVTDESAPEFKDALMDFRQRMVHIVHCFRDREEIKRALARPIKDFKDYCSILASGLPRNFSTIPLDIFLQYQWSISEGQSRTFLDIPKKMKYGPWICAAMPGKWREIRVEKPADTERKALYYVNDNGDEHLFTKNGWFMNSNFANQQVSEDARASSNGSPTGSATSAGEDQNAATGTPAAW